MKKEKEKSVQLTPFALYFRDLPEEQQAELTQFFKDFDAHVLLSKRETLSIRADFENALLYYANAGVPFEQALERLHIENLGGFYARPATLWYSLDGAAKIYPLSMRHGQMTVFRMSVYFRREIVPELLQMALTFTIKRFPSFATTVKKGLFWHYLDACKCRYGIEPESDVPCRPLQISRSGSQAFRVVYCQNRLSIEYFHVLTDGAGGMTFLKTLAAEYLRLLGVAHGGCGCVFDVNALPAADETANEFARSEKAEGLSGFMQKPALQLSGRPASIKPCRIVHFKMSTSRLKAVAKSKGVTVTTYLISRLFVACKRAIDEQKGGIAVQVPVNMRKFFPSNTVRNFSMYCSIRIPIEQVQDPDLLLADIAQQLSQRASKETMGEMMAATKNMNRLLCAIPLPIKAPVARIVYGFLGDIGFTTTLSNLGIVQMPQEQSQHIDCFDFMIESGCGLVTYEDTAMLTITKTTLDPSFEEALHRLLVEDGVELAVEGSEQYEG
jgi:hypothetical protein